MARRLRGKLYELREKLAELEHEQWIVWSRSISMSEQLSANWLERWRKMWIPYSNLTEEQKDQDREWADKVLDILGLP